MDKMASEVEKVCEFLKQRGVTNAVTEKFMEEKMDFEAVQYASEEVLTTFGLKARGDIFALKRFCDTQLLNTSASPSDVSEALKNREKRKKELYDIITQGKKKKGKSDEKTQSTRKRNVSLGWLHYDEKKKKYCSVRNSRGGGSRDVALSVDSTKEDILECAKSLFFPNNTSVFGNSCDMMFNLGNFKEEVITGLFSLGAYLQTHKLSRLRLYLISKKVPASEKNTILVDSDDNKDLPSASLLLGTTKERNTLRSVQDREYLESLCADQAKEKQKETEKREEVYERDRDQRLESLRLARQNRIPSEPSTTEIHVTVQVRHYEKGVIRRRFHYGNSMMAVYDWVGSLSQLPEHFHLSVEPSCALTPDDPVAVVEGKMVHMTVTEDPIPMAKESNEQEISFIGYGPDQSDQLPDDTMLDNNENEMAGFDIEHANEDVPNQLLADDESSPEDDIVMPSVLTSQPVPQHERGRHFRQVMLPQILQQVENKSDCIEKERKNALQQLLNLDTPKIVELERWNVVPVLLKMYCNDNMLDCVLQFNFKGELGFDHGGLSREVYSLFWKQGSTRFFEGSDYSFIPRHSGISKDDLVVIGKVIHHSFILTGMFPVCINRAYIQAMLLGEEEVSEDLLLNSYMEYLGSYEGGRLAEILSSSSLDNEDKQFIIDLEDRVGLQINPDTPTTARKIVLELANNELLQLPLHTMSKVKSGMMACQQGKNIWQNISEQDIDGIYGRQAPEPSKVASLVITRQEELTKKEAKIFSYLKRYINSADKKRCEEFLRYCTASSTIVVDEIKVAFFKSSSLQPLPRAHTCGAVLELPSSGYSSYNLFKNTMDSLLENPLAYHFKFA